MVSSRNGGRERVNAFEVDGTYLFSHYFEGEAVFDRLKRFYNNQGYRFEVPAEEFDGLFAFLEGHGYDLARIEDLAPYVVVVKKYTAHPENIFKSSVIHRGAEGYNCFLMTDQVAVAEAAAAGAVRLAVTDLANPF